MLAIVESRDDVWVSRVEVTNFSASVEERGNLEIEAAPDVESSRVGRVIRGDIALAEVNHSTSSDQVRRDREFWGELQL